MKRRRFLEAASLAACGSFVVPSDVAGAQRETNASTEVTIFLGGDVMTGRGIDQILANPGKPELHEKYLKSALDYVALAERANGTIERPVAATYIWGDALTVLAERAPQARIVNLETAITTADDAWPAKEVLYRMNPANVVCLSAAKLDACAIANNHVLDWGYLGLAETLSTLKRTSIATVGAGLGLAQAQAPAIVSAGASRIVVFAMGGADAGVPPAWAASAQKAGLAYVEDFSVETADALASRMRDARRSGDVVVASLHWGSNWGYDVPRAHRTFAHRLIDAGAADIVHGHSSHHPRPIEIYRQKPILYGCGDLVNDYEGIGAYGEFRPELGLLYFVTVRAGDGTLVKLDAVPMRRERLRLGRARRDDVTWVAQTLRRISADVGTSVEAGDDGALRISHA